MAKVTDADRKLALTWMEVTASSPKPPSHTLADLIAEFRESMVRETREEVALRIEDWQQWYTEELDSGSPVISAAGVMRAMLPRIVAAIRALGGSDGE